jgi:flagellar biosynthesis activator protein FlaF
MVDSIPGVYESVQRESCEGRELEATVLLKAVQKLSNCYGRWEKRNTPEFREQLDEALQFNQQLWTLFQVELSNPSNPLPLPLRQNLLRLSRFIDRRTFALIANGQKEDLRLLIRINQDIASGLAFIPLAEEPRKLPVVEEQMASTLNLEF